MPLRATRDETQVTNPLFLRPVLAEQLNDFSVALFLCQRRQSPALTGLSLRVGAILRQHFDRLCIAPIYVMTTGINT